MSFLPRVFRGSITNTRDLTCYVASVTALCVAIALAVDVTNQLVFFVDWPTCLRSWLITTVLVLALAIPISRVIGKAQLELYRAKQIAEALGRTDQLTGLANRRAFDDALLREYRRARREKQSLGLVMIDVDWFKPFNDRHGHVAGDDCLRRVAGAISSALQRPGDVAARYGGEEFAALLPDTDARGAAEVAERIRQAVLGLAISHDTSAIKLVTVSAGVAAAREIGPEQEAVALVHAADQALYRAKRDGRNRVMCAIGADPPKRTNSVAAA